MTVNLNSSHQASRLPLMGRLVSLGPEQAKELYAAMSSQTDDMGLEALKYIDPIMIANYIRTEHPQTIALIISYLTDIDQVATF